MNIKELWKNIKKVPGEIKYKDIEETGKDIGYFAYDLAEWVAIAGVAIISSTFLGLIVYKIMAVGGIPAIFAELMASACLDNPAVPCEFNTLMGGVGLAVVVLTAFTIALIRMVNKFETVPFDYFFDNQDEPCRHYNEKQVKVLRVIQALGGEQNLLKFANYQDIPYTTMRNYMEQFEKDGYIAIHSNGKGAPLSIELIK